MWCNHDQYNISRLRQITISISVGFYTIYINQLHLKSIEGIKGLKSKPIKVVKRQ